MRTAIRRPAVLAVAAVATLGLTLTACGGDGDGAKDKADAASAPAGQNTTGAHAEKADAGSPASAAEAHAPAAPVRAEKPVAAGTKATGGKVPACTFEDVKITAEKQDGTPTTHLTLTATNTSGHTCTLLRYPLIAFGDLHTAKDVPAVAKSKPAVRVVLNAGEPAYAAVRINNGGVHEDNHVVTSFTVNLFAPEGPAEGSKDVKAPRGGIAVDDAVAKTGYWTTELRNGADEF
ncbi:DUF4232 domain-containing protein [Streptomyces catenulae]|uniref:DUF4232 domain-containing protein n=1 Tax=Streptomyces catenulae TaxID=66875 RepID=A0ABV2Z4F6_9ACTN|nr:DUF4232 domain-containing protein [Streptomyces catenulae]